MATKVLLSVTLNDTTAALASLDSETLERLSRRMGEVAEGRLQLEHEPLDRILASHRMLASVLAVTEKNMRVVERRRSHRMGNQWAR